MDCNQKEKKPNLISRSPVSFILVLMVFFTLVRAGAYIRNSGGYDFYQFWGVGHVIRGAGIHNIYSESTRRKIGSELLRKANENPAANRQLLVAKNRRVFETYSTPFLYAVFHFFSFGYYSVDLQVYLFFSLASILFAIVCLCKLLNYSPVATMAMIPIFLEWFGPFFSDVRVANVNQVQLGLLTLFMWFQSKHRWRSHSLMSGVILGFAAMFKPNMVFVVVMLVVSWVINRRYRKLVFEFMGILIAVVAAFIYGGVFLGSMHGWAEWFAALQLMPADIITVEMGNFALAKLIWNWLGIHVSMYLSIFFVVLTTTFLWMSRRTSRAIAGAINGDIQDRERAFYEDALMVASGCLIYLLSAPLAWLHYYVLTIPMAILVLRPMDTYKPDTSGEFLTRRLLPLTAIIGLSVDPVVWLFKIENPNVIAFIMCASTLILFGLALWELWLLGRKDYNH